MKKKSLEQLSKITIITLNIFILYYEIHERNIFLKVVKMFLKIE